MLSDFDGSCHVMPCLKSCSHEFFFTKNNPVPPMFHTFYIQTPVAKKSIPPYFIHYSKMSGVWLKHHPPDCIHFALMYDTNGVTLYPLCFILFTKTVFFEFYVKAGYPPSFIHCKKCKKMYEMGECI